MDNNTAKKMSGSVLASSDTDGMLKKSAVSKTTVTHFPITGWETRKIKNGLQ